MILTTKLQRPPLRANQVARPRLSARLNRALDCKITLITAPAGFGKTTLVASWAEATRRPVAWLSLDPQDDSLTRWLRYVIHALREVVPACGEAALDLMSAAHQPQTDMVLTHLINDLADDPILLVLDDYHVITDSAIHDALNFLIAHLPPTMHVILTSRSQPPLNVVRLRGQAQLLELDAGDLRFTAAEVEVFLRDVMQVTLPAADRLTLEMRTEGWIAGVQLAALSLQSQADPTAFVASLSGTDRLIGDYLFEEVLRHQPPDSRHFLLHTALVDRLCASLCDALLGQSNSQATLEQLDARHVFIVPLDNQRQWYRYHHLFADLLRHELERTDPEQVVILHRRASRWYQAHGQLDDAIRHALLAQDYEYAADFIEQAFVESDWIHQDMHQYVEWFTALPEAVTQARPKLHQGYAWLLFEIYGDEWVRIDQHLQQVERVLVTQADPILRAQIDLLRANRARYNGDIEQMRALCQRILDDLPEGESYIRSGTLAHLALAYEIEGDLTRASALYADSVRRCQKAGNIDGLLFATAHLLEVYIMQGQLHQALVLFESLQPTLALHTGPDAGSVLIASAEVYRLQNKLDTAQTYLEHGIDACRPFEAWHGAALTGVYRLAAVTFARTQSEVAVEQTLINAGQHLSYAKPLQASQLEFEQARLYLMLQDYDSVRRYLSHIDLPALLEQTDFAYEYDQITLVRALLAQASYEARGMRYLDFMANPLMVAGDLLDRLYMAAINGGRGGRVIEIRLLHALVHRLQGHSDLALSCLGDALKLAEPAGTIRLFTDEGIDCYQLLLQLSTRPAADLPLEYVRQLLSAFPAIVRDSVQKAAPIGSTLTAREMDTLRLLASERSIEDIADGLGISVSTVRTYAKRIYSKLDVHSRAEAIYRAQTLKLV